MKKYALSTIAVLLVVFACSKNNTGNAIVSTQDSSLQKMMPFHMGASVSPSLLQNNSSYKAVVTKEFNSITPENAMKFAGVHASATGFDFTNADYIVDFALKNNKRVHGHTLVWHQSLPEWVKNFTGDSAAWENLLKTHIQTVVTHFKGKVSSWDVVNEAIDDNGNMRNSLWLQKLGNDYVARCFKYAHEADPNVLLFYNDYGQEYSMAKRTAIIKMLQSFKTRGIPIDGIGLQFHTRYTQTDANIAAAINAAAATGLKVHISELDISLNPNNTLSAPTAALLQQQADRYKFIVKTYNAIPAAQQYGITTWNVSDADSWIPTFYKRRDWPLPFDTNYMKKPAYYAILQGVQ